MIALTPRQVQYRDALLASKCNKEIAVDLRVSVNTVKFSLARLYDKIGVRDRHEAATYFRSADGPLTVHDLEPGAFDLVLEKVRKLSGDQKRRLLVVLLEG